MQKRHKKALGLASLAAVVAMTSVAAGLPSPASAVSSVSDTITITVVNNDIGIVFTNLTDGTVVTDKLLNVGYSYSGLQKAIIKLTYKDNNNQLQTVTVGERNYTSGNSTGTDSITINLNDYGGYGKYTVSLEGEGYGVTATPQSVAVKFSPVSIAGIGSTEGPDGTIVDSELDIDEETGNPIADIKTDGEVAEVDINIYDEDGNHKNPHFPIVYIPGSGPFIIPFTDLKLPTGDYTIEFVAKNSSGDVIGTIRILYHYEALSTPDVPKTGGLIGKLNIAKADYITSSLIIFGLALIAAAVLFRKKKSNRRR